MAGIDPLTGDILDEAADIRASIATILKTPVGTRLMRRPFGSEILEVVDSPANELGALRVIAAAADAVARWEPRVRVKSARLDVGLDGAATLDMVCQIKTSGLTVTAAARVGV